MMPYMDYFRLDTAITKALKDAKECEKILYEYQRARLWILPLCFLSVVVMYYFPLFYLCAHHSVGGFTEIYHEVMINSIPTFGIYSFVFLLLLTRQGSIIQTLLVIQHQHDQAKRSAMPLTHDINRLAPPPPVL